MAKTKVELQNYQGESLSPITIASNVLYEDGRNAQEVFEEYSNETFTPTIENSSSMFKVGQGDSVDYSDNIVNGAYESMVLKGKSMVNCIQEPSSQDVVLPYEFEDGQYVTINDTKESGALGVELKGQTLVNLASTATLKSKDGGSGTFVNGKLRVNFANYTWSGVCFLNNGMMKPSTEYTLIAKATNTTSFSIEIGHTNGAYNAFIPVNLSRLTLGAGESGSIKIALTTRDDLESDMIFYNVMATENPSSYSGNKFIDIELIILEGNYTNVDIPFFTGMTSCKMPILKSVESLFDAQKIIPNNTFTYSHSTNIGRFEFTNRVDVVANTNIQLPAGTYDISFLVRGACDNGRVAITFAKDGQVWHNCSRVEINYGEIGSTTFKEVKSQRTFDAPVTVTIVGHAWSGSAIGSGWCEFKDIRFTPVGKTSILSLPEEVVLRSLPNGVKDTLNLKTGEYVQRIGEVTLTGGESFVRESNAQYNRFQYKNSGCITQSQRNPINSNTFVSVTEAAVHRNQMGFAYGGAIYLYSPVGSTQTVEEFKTWLQDNPTTIQYQLENPIITKINLSSTLKSWNTTTHIYSEIPENTLYPILSHSNPTYPVILKPSTKYSIVANSYSNNHTNSAINFNLGGATASTTVGNRVTTITTPSTLSNELLTMSGRGNKLNNVMVIEGDVVGDEPYFEGMCDCKSPILSNVGKNLFNINGEWHKSTYSHSIPVLHNGSQTMLVLEDGVQITTNNNQYHAAFGQFINIRGINNLRISFTGEYTDTKTVPEIVVQLLHKDEELPKTMSNTLASTDYNHRKTSFKLSQSGETVSKTINTQGYECAYVHLCGGYLASMSGTYTFVAKNICIEDADQVDIYEPYKSNTTTFEQKDGKTIVLRSLPNGVCDTLNVETGEYVQRIGDYTVNGTEASWFTYIDTTGVNNNYLNQTSCAFGVHLTGKAKGNGILCDKLPTRSIGWWGGKHTGEGICGIENDNRIFLRVKNEKTGVLYTDNVSTALEKAKTYLASNPVTVQYELATPIVSTIDIQGFPYAYTNGHVQLSSGHNGQSLTPKVEYSVATNRNGQIRSNQKMVERHQKQLDQLQAIILANMVNTQYQQTLTTLNYDLLKKEVGE